MASKPLHMPGYRTGHSHGTSRPYLVKQCAVDWPKIQGEQAEGDAEGKAEAEAEAEGEAEGEGVWSRGLVQAKAP